MAPSQVNSANEETVRKRLYPPRKSTGWKFDRGQTVRIVMQKLPFQKGYEEGRWLKELFVVDQLLPTKPVTYRLVDASGESIKGSFYEAELQKVRKPDEDSLFTVERVVRSRRKRNGKIEYLVQWEGYPDKFNSWTDDLITRQWCHPINTFTSRCRQTRLWISFLITRRPSTWRSYRNLSNWKGNGSCL